jgi:hypothetical protein
VSWLLQTGFIDAFAIELRGIDRLLTRAARVAHGIIPNPSSAREQAVDMGYSTMPATMSSACVTPQSEVRRESRQATKWINSRNPLERLSH